MDSSEHLLFVADAGNNRIDVFDADSDEFIRAFGWGVSDGTSSALQVCTATCFAGLSGGGSGEFSSLEGIAVDNDPSSPAYHAVYVYDNGNHRVQRFSAAGAFIWMVGGGVNQSNSGNLCTAASGDICRAGTTGFEAGHFNEVVAGGVAVGPGGTLYVADQIGEAPNGKVRVQKFAPSGALLESLTLTTPAGFFKVTGLAVDSGGNIYVATNNETGAVRKFSPVGVELFEVNPSFNNTAIAVDSTARLLVADPTAETQDAPVISKVLAYDSAGTQVHTYYGTFERALTGIAPYTNSNGDLFTAELQADGSTESGIRHIAYEPPGPIVYPRGLEAGSIVSKKATLKAKINPEGEPTSYHFEYISDEAFQANGGAFGPGAISTPETSLGYEDFIQHPVQFQITGLFPETLYHFRAVATNPSGADDRVTSSFETKGPLEIDALWTAKVGISSAVLHAEVNPLETPATARFEYVELSEYEVSGFANAQEAPASSEDPIDLGEGEEMEEVSTQLGGLQPGTSYRYRIVATNRCKPEPAPLCEFDEVEGTFTTFVPLEARESCPNHPFRTGSTAFLPNCRAYEMVSPVNKEGGNIESVNNINGFVAGLEQAALDGNSIAFSSYKAFGDVDAAPYANQYLARRGGEGWINEAISPKREGPSLMTYLSAELDRQYKAFSPDLCSGWVVQDAKPILAEGGIEGYPGLYRREDCGVGTGSFEAITRVEEPLGPQPPNLPPRKFIPELQGVSSDGSTAVFSVHDNLTIDAPAQPQACIDEPSPSAEECQPRVYEARAGELRYVCILPSEIAYAGACAAGNSGGGGTAERSGSMTHAVSEDGSRIFWTAAGSETGKLYLRLDNSQPSAETIEVSSAPATQFWIAAADGSKAIYSVGDTAYEFDLSTETSTPISGGFRGVAGASDDASRVYLASTEALTGSQTNSAGDEAQAGALNLYLYEAGDGFKFIGTVPSVEGGPAEPSALSRFPSRHLASATPDGEQLAFMTKASLTGYDNTDALSGETDYEVFLYSAETGGPGTLVCPSCNPSNARPEGQELSDKAMFGRWAAARIPVWESQLYGPRYLTDDGTRLYFDSFESLVSTDTNGKEDVYQWEQAGAGNCEEEGDTYQPSSGGCLDLISSGRSPQGSELTDISADGGDVFFKTYESLLSQDPDRLDIYDARVLGGFEPQQPLPPICRGEMCLEDPAPAPVALSPSSQAAGPGNPPVAKPKPRRCRKGTHKVRRKGKVRCVKHKHKHKKAGKNRRAGR